MTEKEIKRMASTKNRQRRLNTWIVGVSEDSNQSNGTGEILKTIFEKTFLKLKNNNWKLHFARAQCIHENTEPKCSTSRHIPARSGTLKKPFCIQQRRVCDF